MKFIGKEALHEMPTETLKKDLDILVELINLTKESRKNLSQVRPSTMLLFDFFAAEDGHPEIKYERVLEKYDHEISKYSRHVELIREELERRTGI